MSVVYMHPACSVSGCPNPSKIAGLCGGHYQRKNKGRPVESSLISRTGDWRICSVDGCERVAVTKGLCDTHYNRSRNNRPLDVEIRPHRIYEPGQRCMAPGCDRGGKRILGFCQAHYIRHKKGHDLDAPLKGVLLGKGKSLTSYGYVQIVVPEGTPGAHKKKRSNSYAMPEHRYVMQNVLGRPLMKCETPHHLNGVRSDNRPENLELWSHAQPPGQRVADKVSFAVEILTLYPGFVGLDLVDMMSLKKILASVSRKIRKC